jgi:protein gp37
MGNSKIEWTDKVWNPVTGCNKISPGCDNCYAYSMSKRFCKEWGLSADDPFKVTLHPERLEQPLRWTKPSKIFVCSMADLFHDDVPTDFIYEVFDRIAACAYKNLGHIFMILTKRPERMAEIFNYYSFKENVCWWQDEDEVVTELPWPLPNVWLGVTAENQEQANKRIPVLLQIPAAVRFVSAEPILGPVDLNQLLVPEDIRQLHFSALQEQHDDCYYSSNNLLNWVICGGESGPGARPMHPNWARSLRDQCEVAGVPFFFKQWGEWLPAECRGNGETFYRNVSDGKMSITYSDWGKSRYHWWGGNFGDGKPVSFRIGKKSTGSLLDGQEWKQFPKVGA